MDFVADASVFLAVVLNERDRDWIIERTSSCAIAAPEVLPYEVGNALIVVRRKGRLTETEALRALDSAPRIHVRLLPVTIHQALKLALQFGIYAYDAYYLQCCIENRLPLISLDARMCAVAKQLKLSVVEKR